MDERKKKITFISICSVVLVAMVVVLVISIAGGDKEEVPELSASQKAITTICETTDYQATCLDSLAGHNTSNPKELIEVAFQASIGYIKEAAKNSSTLQGLQKDPRAKAALQTCGELANRAIDDLQRSFNKFSSFDITGVDDILLDLKIWLSGAITHQETCLDSFEDVPGDSGKKMADALKTATEMTSNALAMVAEISTFLESMGMQSFSSRRLLSADLPVLGHGDELPDWLDSGRRRLLTASPQIVKPDLIVAKDGSGNYRTINEALIDIPKKGNKTFVLYIKEGVYEEKVQFNSSLTHLFVIGDGPTKTRITGKLNFIDGTNTYQTATVAVQGDDFIARDIGFENTAGPEKHQAVALRVSADRAIFYNCHMDAYQDTLYAHTYRQFYRNCYISGTIDFIFGDSAAVFQNCTMLIRKPLDNQQCIVTAQGRKEIRQPTGLVLQNCTFVASPELYPFRTKIKSYLGRPWKEYSRTIIMESFLDDLIQPDGWLPWNATFALDTLFYTEFNNRGPAAPKKQRVKWGGIKELPSTRIKRFTAAEFLDASRWIPLTQVPYDPGFIFPVPKDDPNVKYSPVVPEETKDLGSKLEKLINTPPPIPSKDSSSGDKHSDSPPSTTSTGSNTTSTGTSAGGTTPTPPSKESAASPPPPIPPSASSVVIIETNVSEIATSPNALVDHKALSPTSPSEDTSALPPTSNHGVGFQPDDVLALPPNTQTQETSRMTPAPTLSPGGSNSEHQTDMVASAPVSPDHDSDSMQSDAFASAPTSDKSNSISVPLSDLTASAPASPQGDEIASATNSQGGVSVPAQSPTQANDETNLPPTTSETGSSGSPPPPSDEASLPPTTQSGSSDSSTTTEDTAVPNPTSSSSSSDLSPPQPETTASPTASPTGTSTTPPAQSDETAPLPTSPTGISSSTDDNTTPPPPPAQSDEASGSSSSTDHTTPPPTSPSGSSSSTDNTTPPPTSPSGSSSSTDNASPPPTSSDVGSTPSPPESDTTTSPPTSMTSNSNSPPPPIDTDTATPPPIDTTSNSDSPPPTSDSTTSTQPSMNSSADSPPPPIDTATTPPTSPTGNSVPSPPQSDTATPPPASPASDSVATSQSEAATAPTSQP